MTPEQWRSKRLNRKCIFCKFLKMIVVPVHLPGADYYVCKAKDKYLNHILPDMTRVPRPFCQCFELKEVEK